MGERKGMKEQKQEMLVIVGKKNIEEIIKVNDFNLNIFSSNISNGTDTLRYDMSE